MPIHDQSYRRYAGERLPAGLAWRVIARAAIVARVKTRLCLGLLLIAWLPFLARAVQIYVASTLPEAAALVAVSPRLFHDFLAQQAPFVFFLTVYVGSGLVADDRRSHALQIYLARPLTRAEYLAGKLVVPAVFLAAVTVVPALLLAIVQLAFDGPSFLGEHLYVVPAILLVSGIEVIVASFTVVACSSLSTSRRFAAAVYAAVVFFATPVAAAGRAITGSAAFSYLAPPALLGVVNDAAFRLPSNHGIPVAGAFVALAALVALSTAVLVRHVRGVEVVE